MPKARLNKTFVHGAKHMGVGNFTVYRDTELPGLGLRVTAGGVKSYVVEYRHRGRKHRVTLGRHGPLTVDEARKLAKRELLGHHAKARRGPREGLRWGDIDLDAGTNELAAHGGGSGGKGGDPRRLPLGRGTVELLRGLRPDDVDLDAPVVPAPRTPAQCYNGLNKARRHIHQAAVLEGVDAHSLRHSFESIAFSIAPAFAGALTGRAFTRDATLNSYLHAEENELRSVADQVAGRIAQAMAGELADVVLIEQARR